MFSFLKNLFQFKIYSVPKFVLFLKFVSFKKIYNQSLNFLKRKKKKKPRKRKTKNTTVPDLIGLQPNKLLGAQWVCGATLSALPENFSRELKL
jgi:hypothetical protein